VHNVISLAGFNATFDNLVVAYCILWIAQALVRFSLFVKEYTVEFRTCIDIIYFILFLETFFGYIVSAISRVFKCRPHVKIRQITGGMTNIALQKPKDCSSSAVTWSQMRQSIWLLSLATTPNPSCSNSNVMTWSVSTIAWNIALANLGKFCRFHHMMHACRIGPW